MALWPWSSLIDKPTSRRSLPHLMIRALPHSVLFESALHSDPSMNKKVKKRSRIAEPPDPTPWD
eukprot:38804-Eustigmatos_ZCMA.PRE.1